MKSLQFWVHVNQLVHTSMYFCKVTQLCHILHPSLDNREFRVVKVNRLQLINLAEGTQVSNGGLISSDEFSVEQPVILQPSESLFVIFGPFLDQGSVRLLFLKLEEEALGKQVSNRATDINVMPKWFQI